MAWASPRATHGARSRWTPGLRRGADSTAITEIALDKATIDEACYRTPRDFFKLPIE
ncbi:MAG: hypothetical protein NTX16_12695 [Actinobacteria bacterium]|nr:hypothetical protein [Actinomycetota bacterium]